EASPWLTRTSAREHVDVDKIELVPDRLRRHLGAGCGEGAVQEGMHALFEEQIAGRLRLPDVDVAQAALDARHGVHEATSRRLGPKALHDPCVDVSRDGQILCERIHRWGLRLL